MRRKKGEGTCWQRSEGTWEGEITVGKDEHGKRVKRYTTGRTAQECLDKLAQLREDYLRASSRLSPSLSAKMTLGEFIRQYWGPSVRLGVSARTWDRMFLDAGYVLRYLRQTPLGEITPALILRVLAQMGLDGLTDYQRFKGAKILRRILAYAVKLDFLLKSPAQDIPLPKYRLEEMQPLTPEQVNRLLEANKEEWIYTMLVVALDTGAREGELFALEWADWDGYRCELHINKSLESYRDQLRIKEPKTRAGRRTVIVGEGTCRILNEYQERQERKGSSLIFPNSEGGYHRYSNFYRDHWKPALKRAGLEGFRFHDLRHTTATLLLMAGDNARSIADRLGHTTPDLILKTYGHVLPQMRRESARLMEQFLRKKDRGD